MEMSSSACVRDLASGMRWVPSVPAARARTLAGGILRDLRSGGSQVGRGLGGFLDRAGEHGADASVLQHEQAGDGAAGGGGDVVAESGRMTTGVEHHARGAQGGL